MERFSKETIAQNRQHLLEAILYPILVVVLMWLSFFVDRYLNLNLYTYGVKPGTVEGLKGIIFMPFIHSQKDFSHLINNSFPTLILLACLIYFYRNVALKVIVIIWLGTGILLWYIAVNTGSYHIGMSGVIYGLFGFLLVSGFLIRSLPLQAISLFVAFLYGSLVWGIFPTDEAISWEGHLAGLLTGVLLAFIFRKMGPRPKKYRYEIEEELGIEPPDLEGIWKENIRIAQEKYQERQAQLHQKEQAQQKGENEPLQNHSATPKFKIEYHYLPKKKE